MKKIIFLLLFLLIPFIVNAEVKITNVQLDSHTEGLEAEEKPDFEGLKIIFNLQFKEVGEFVKYKVTINNDTKKDYEIEDISNVSKKGYFKYDLTYINNEKIVKPNESKDVYITVTYDKEVPNEEYNAEGVYTKKENFVINLSPDDVETAAETKETEEKNPQTKTSNYIIFSASIIIFVSLIAVIFSKRKLDFLRIFLIGSLIAIPLTIYALEKITIEVEANVEIEKETHEFCYTFGDIIFIENSTWEEFVNNKNLNPDHKFSIYNDKIVVSTDGGCGGTGIVYTNDEPVKPTDKIIEAGNVCYSADVISC